MSENTTTTRDSWIDMDTLDDYQIAMAREDGSLNIAADVMLRINMAIAFGTDMFRNDVY